MSLPTAVERTSLVTMLLHMLLLPSAGAAGPVHSTGSGPAHSRSVRGRIVAQEGGVCARASIRAMAAGEPEPRADERRAPSEEMLPLDSTTSDEEGRFLLSLPEGRPVLIVALARGRAPACARVRGTGDAEIALSLARASRVTGCFREAGSGNPAGAVAATIQVNDPDLARACALQESSWRDQRASAEESSSTACLLGRTPF